MVRLRTASAALLFREWTSSPQCRIHLWLQPVDVATVEVCIWIAAKTQVLESNSKVLQFNIKIVQCLQRDLSNLIYVKQLVTKRKGFSDQVKCQNYWFLFMLYNWEIHHEILYSLTTLEQSKNERWAVEYDSSYRSFQNDCYFEEQKSHKVKKKKGKECKTEDVVTWWPGLHK